MNYIELKIFQKYLIGKNLSKSKNLYNYDADFLSKIAEDLENTKIITRYDLLMQEMGIKDVSVDKFKRALKSLRDLILNNLISKYRYYLENPDISQPLHIQAEMKRKGIGY